MEWRISCYEVLRKQPRQDDIAFEFHWKQKVWWARKDLNLGPMDYEDTLHEESTTCTELDAEALMRIDWKYKGFRFHSYSSIQLSPVRGWAQNWAQWAEVNPSAETN
jgi:hypothetical protein